MVRMPAAKDKMKILKVTRKNQFITYREIPYEMMKVRRLWNDIFKVLNEKHLSTKNHVP